MSIEIVKNTIILVAILPEDPEMGSTGITLTDAP